mmetsp:Transcript_35941/g.99669  ORF Transcript_35941/g.99669 Transcript_35941/m.99669 type:complete len:100 (-) Transcript_35941:369-668(-)
MTTLAAKPRALALGMPLGTVAHHGAATVQSCPEPVCMTVKKLKQWLPEYSLRRLQQQQQQLRAYRALAATVIWVVIAVEPATWAKWRLGGGALVPLEPP